MGDMSAAKMRGAKNPFAAGGKAKINQARVTKKKKK
jgi:hypothetical protein